MRCEAHPGEDAVGICQSCGRGVCASCKVMFNAVVHCKACIEAGKMAVADSVPAVVSSMDRPPDGPEGRFVRLRPLAVSRPAGPPNPRLYMLGEVGSLSGGLACIALAWGFTLWGTGSEGAPVVAATLAVILAVCEISLSIGVFGIFKNLGLREAHRAAWALALGASAYGMLAIWAAAATRTRLMAGVYYSGWGAAFLAIGGAAFAFGLLLTGNTIREAARYLPDHVPANLAGYGLPFAGGLIVLASLLSLPISINTTPAWLIAAGAHFVTLYFFGRIRRSMTGGGG